MSGGAASTDARVAVRVRQLPHAHGLPLPAYETEGAAGLDVRAALDAPVAVTPGTIVRVPTGLVVEIPPGYELQLRPRSGLAAKHGLTLANSPATVDSDYRGEIFVALVLHGPEPVTVDRGMRIAQMVLARVPRLVWEPAEELGATTRGAGGFGHTGTT